MKALNRLCSRILFEVGELEKTIRLDADEPEYKPAPADLSWEAGPCGVSTTAFFYPPTKTATIVGEWARRGDIERLSSQVIRDATARGMAVLESPINDLLASHEALISDAVEAANCRRSTILGDVFDRHSLALRRVMRIAENSTQEWAAANAQLTDALADPTTEPLTKRLEIIAANTIDNSDNRTAHRRGQKATETPLRSWTQSDVDRAIEDYKARRAANYNELIERVTQGAAGARKAAQEMFGQRAITRELRIKSKTMVGKSSAWHSIADALQLPRRSSKMARLRPADKIGLSIAIERQAETSPDPTIEEVQRKEAIRAVNRLLSRVQAEATVERLERGDMTPAEAMQMVELLRSKG